MDDPAVLDVNLPGQFPVGDFEDGRIAAEAFHLDDILQTDPAQHALKTRLLFPGDQFVEHDENGFQAFGRARFFNEQFRAAGQTGGTPLLGRVTGNGGFFEAGKTPGQDAQELLAVYHGHVHVHHNKVEGTGLEDFERLIGGGGALDLP